MATPPPAAAPAPQGGPNQPNVAAGTLLGTQAFQHAVDQLDRVITQLGSRLTAMQGTQAQQGFGGAPTAGAGGLHGTPPTMSSGPAQQAQLTSWRQMGRGFLQGASPTMFGRPGGSSGWQGRIGAAAGMAARGAVSIAGDTIGGYYQGLNTFATNLDQFSRQMMLSNPTGGLMGGQLAAAYGRGAARYGGQYWSNGSNDWFSGFQTINQQAYQQNQGRLQTAASATALFNPGMGLLAQAQMQGAFGTAQAFYASQAFGITAPRGAGGVQNAPIDTINSLANRVNANIGGFQNLKGPAFQAEIAQGGSLSTSLSNYGAMAGISPMQQQALLNQLKAENKLTNSGMTLSQAQSVINKFAANPQDKSAIAAFNKAGLPIGSTLSEEQNLIQGKQASGYLDASANYLDAAKATANTLQDIWGLLNKVLSPFAGVAGAYGSGGVLGAVMNVTGLGDLFGGGGGGGGGSAATGPLASTPQRTNPVFASRFGAIPSRGGSRTGGGASLAAGGGQGGSGSIAGSGSSAANAGAALAFAQKQLGDPYQWGATGPNTWDCSGLTQAAWAAAGVKLPRRSEEQSAVGVPISLDQAGPGDLIFYGSVGTAQHVGIVSGPDQVLEAPHTGDVVKYESISADPGWKFARRVSGGISAATSTMSGGTPGGASSTQGGIGGGSILGGEEVDVLASLLSGGGGGLGTWSGGAGGGGITPGTQTTNAANGASPKAASGNINTNGYTKQELANVALGQQMAAAYGWTGTQWEDLFKVWNQESTWNADAQNPSGAYGIPQALGHGHPFNLGDARSQIAWGLNYIKSRYGDPAHAWSQEVAQGWYSGGISEVVGDKLAMLHDGEMVLTANQARDARRRTGAGTGGSGGTVSINMGGVTISMANASASEAQSAAKTFVDFVSADDRIKSLMGGW